jgi:sarcosine oxidase subunit alpha
MSSLRVSVGGGGIERDRSVRFAFDGKTYEGCAGDTLASALLANGIRLIGRSFKYHRPRGILSAGAEEPNALVELRSGARREPNTRATTVELYNGLTAESQNRWPSLSFDLLGLTSPFASLMTAGFYYKTFMWPAAFWEKLYEPLIRRAAGLGRAAGQDDPDHYEKATAFCDVLIVGGGAAGLAAALATGRSGARAILCDEDFRLGGRLLSERCEINGMPSLEWLRSAEAELRAMPEVRIMSRTTVFGMYDHGTFGAVERVNDHVPVPPEGQPRQRTWRIVAKRAILCSGAIERPMAFGNNDLPGVMLAGAVRSYLNRFGVAAGQNVVVATSCDDGWRTARDLTAAGLSLAAIIDTRPHASVEIERSGVKARVFHGARISSARGARSIKAVEVIDSSGKTHTVACDLLAMSNGWEPVLHLASHLHHRPAWDESCQIFVPKDLPPHLSAAGAAAGNFTLAQGLTDGSRLGAEAAEACGFQATPDAFQTDAENASGTPSWGSAERGGKAFIDFQNDVTESDIALAHQEGYRAVEHLKRYTTLGMATDQGKTSNVTGLALMAGLRGRTIPQTGTTVFRPPYTPVAIGALAGHHRGKTFRSTRLPPSHDWAKTQGAVFVEAGAWLRAQYYPQASEHDWLAAMTREVNTVRGAVGVCDVSTLGKIDIQGTDAGIFLDRIYCNGFAKLPVGKARYGLMLREDGFIMDDGTTSRLGDNHFIMTTTTANAAKVMQHLEFCHQVLWPSLDVQMVSVSEQWAQFSIAGPRARDTLRDVIDRQHDISNDAFPYLAAKAVTVGGGISARLFRISFSGELAYELAVPASFGDSAIRAIMQAGQRFGIAPYGTEALSAMRIEKGHVAGNELNGQTTAYDLGLQRMVSSKKDFIGRAMASREALHEPDRPRFVGFKPVDPKQRLTAGAHFIPLGKPAKAENDEGYMTSVTVSPTVGHSIGLGFVKRGPERTGEHLRAVDLVRELDIEVEICSPIFVDPNEEKLRV